MTDDKKGEKFVLQGTVTAIRPMKGHHPHQKWLVTLQVDTVISGNFAGQTFSFFIHSPTKSGIVNHGQYVIHVVQIQTGENLLERIEPWNEKYR